MGRGVSYNTIAVYCFLALLCPSPKSNALPSLGSRSLGARRSTSIVGSRLDLVVVASRAMIDLGSE